MPSDLPDYAALNETARGTAPGRGRLLGKRILVVAGGQRDIGHLPGVDPATIPPSNGRAISVLAGREGAAVAVHNRTVQSAEATAALVRAENDCPKAVAIPGDVTVEEDVKKIIAAAVDQLGGELDGIVINVGDARGAPGLQLSVEDLEYTMRLNFMSHFMFCKHGVPHLKKGGSIVLISSITYAQSSGLISYDASKAALEGLMRNVGAIVAADGTRVNILRIGLADTPMGRNATHNSPARMGINIPLERRLSTPWEQAYYAIFLLSDDSSYVTGQVHSCDGGVLNLRNVYSH